MLNQLALLVVASAIFSRVTLACSTTSPLDIDSSGDRVTVIEDCIVNLQAGADLAHITYINSSTVNFYPGNTVPWVLGVGNSSANFFGGNTNSISLVNESTLTIWDGGFDRISIFDNATLVLHIQNVSIVDTGFGHLVTGNWVSGSPAEFTLYFADDSGIEDPDLSNGESAIVPTPPTPISNYGPVDSRLILFGQSQITAVQVPIPYPAQIALVTLLLLAHNQRAQSARFACPTPYRSPFYKCFAFYLQNSSLSGAAGANRYTSL